MKNIKDLGGDECVWLPTRKKALKFLNHIGKSHLISKWNEKNKYCFPNEEYFSVTIEMDATLYKISDFISSKPSIKKRLKKAESEIRRLNDLLPEHLQDRKYTVESEASVFDGYIRKLEVGKWYRFANGNYKCLLLPYATNLTDGYLRYIDAENRLEIGRDLVNVIFKYGKLADIIHQPIEPNPSHEIDWSIPGQLVECGNVLVKTSGDHKDSYFSAQVQVSSFWKEGHISSDWIKSSFKLSNKTQTIK